jgi:hypothetical protein
MNQVLFRCSQLGKLMTEPKLKADKEAGLLSETTKTYIKEIWLKNEYGYDEIVVTDAMLKGLLCEQDAMQLVQDVANDGIFREKFKGGILKNDYIMGSPDLVITDNGETIVEDTKCSFTIKSYAEAEMTKIYEWQLRGYMWLTGATKARLRYALIDTPLEIIQEEQKRYFFKFGCDENNKEYQRICEQIEKNHTFSHIPAQKRLKTFEISHDENKIAHLITQIEKCRNFYQKIEL